MSQTHDKLSSTYFSVLSKYTCSIIQTDVVWYYHLLDNGHNENSSNPV